MNIRRWFLAAGWWALVVCVFLAPYAQLRFWSFPASTAVLLGLFLWRWGSTALDRAGLRLEGRQVASVLALAVGLWVFFEYVLAPMLTDDAGLALRPYPWVHVAVFPFQALNEEIVLGALLLFPLVERWRRPVLWSIALAAVFAALHYALYRYGTLDTELAPLTLLGLTAIGCIRHATILLVRHIGYAWAVHASWNVVMFAGSWWVAADDRKLLEPEVFDALLGRPLMVVLASVAAVVLLAALWRSERRTNPVAGRIGYPPAR